MKSETIDREKLLTALNAVKAGLSPREFIEQSSCFVFRDKQVMTFNDEVSCRIDIPLDIEGAIQAQKLLDILGKVEDEELLVEDRRENGELLFKGKRKKFAVTKDEEIFLPIDDIEMPEKKDWKDLSKEFTESIALAKHCASNDSGKFRLTCIHLSPETIEASDNMQAIRCWVDTGLKKSVLVRASSLAHICELGMDQIALTESWIHFRNQSELIFSCRRYSDEYVKLDDVLDFKGESLTFPKGLSKAADAAAIFAMDKAGDPLVTVILRRDDLTLEGVGISGWYEQFEEVVYDGPDMEFSIPPDLLKRLAERYNKAEVSSEKMRITGKTSGTEWEYVTVLASPDEEKEKERYEREDEGKED